MSEYQTKIISLKKNRKLINMCKQAELETFHPQGEYNGYGYTKLPLAVKIKSVGEMRKFNKILKELEMLPEKKELTEEEKIEKWAKRLAKLTDVDIEVALIIAQEKLNYKTEQINELLGRQDERYSRKRETLIRQIERSNPLRYIKNKEHAEAILAAHSRHAESNYEHLLQKFHDMETFGEIEKGEAREMARRECKFLVRNDEIEF